MKKQAASVIKKCGGFSFVAKLLGVDRSRVYRWTYPKDIGGSGGIIPAKYHNELLRKARESGIDLTPEDFFEATPAPTPEAAE